MTDNSEITTMIPEGNILFLTEERNKRKKTMTSPRIPVEDQPDNPMQWPMGDEYTDYPDQPDNPQDWRLN